MQSSMSWRRCMAVGVLGIVLVGTLAGTAVAIRVLGIATAYYAKTLCSGIFVSGRPAGAVIGEDILPKLRGLPDHFSHRIDAGHTLVTAAYLGLVRREALYRPGLGCTLLLDTDADSLLAQSRGLPGFVPVQEPLPAGLPETSSLSPVLSPVLSAAFAEPVADPGRRTRAIVILHRGNIVAERYADGITSDMSLIGWSMGKSVVNALIGILVHQGRLDLDAVSLFREWRGEGDRRDRITPAHLLRMTSGLDIAGEREGLLSLVREMLFERGDAASLSLAIPAAWPPDDRWNYGSSPAILLCRLLRQIVGDGQPTLAFARDALFAQLGMTSAIMEPDASGTPLGAAFLYASARDWARLGQFFLQDGVWQGRRLLPQGWLAFSGEATSQSSGAYGAHFWRKTPGFLRPRNAPVIKLPSDSMFMLGIDGQMVAIVPSLELVVVRLGMTLRPGAFDPDELLAAIVAAVAPGLR